MSKTSPKPLPHQNRISKIYPPDKARLLRVLDEPPSERQARLDGLIAFGTKLKKHQGPLNIKPQEPDVNGLSREPTRPQSTKDWLEPPVRLQQVKCRTESESLEHSWHVSTADATGKRLITGISQRDAHQLMALDLANQGLPLPSGGRLVAFWSIPHGCLIDLPNISLTSKTLAAKDIFDRNDESWQIP